MIKFDKIPYWVIQGRRFAASHLTTPKYAHKFREFKEGYYSFCVGDFTNPYRMGTKQAKNWEHGQNCAYNDYAAKAA